MSAILKTTDKPENIVFQMNDKKQLSGHELLYCRSTILENEPLLKDVDYIQTMIRVKNNYDFIN